VNKRLPESKIPNSVPDGFGLHGISTFILQQNLSPQLSTLVSCGLLAFKVKKQIVAIISNDAGSSFGVILFISSGFRLQN
jgi:hypothetical protein